MTSPAEIPRCTRKSCTEFIADVARTQFGFDDTPLESWSTGDIIDGALYESAAQVWN